MMESDTSLIINAKQFKLSRAKLLVVFTRIGQISGHRENDAQCSHESSNVKTVAVQGGRDGPKPRPNCSRASAENATDPQFGNHKKTLHMFSMLYLSLLTDVVQAGCFLEPSLRSIRRRRKMPGNSSVCSFLDLG
jgi:hypothetical protein